jgi:hypothetical protein
LGCKNKKKEMLKKGWITPSDPVLFVKGKWEVTITDS